MNPLRKKFRQKITPQLQKELKLDNPLAVPRLEKITINTSSPQFHHDEDLFNKTTQWLADITGQKPKLTRAKKSIADFDLQEGDKIGLKVTLRRDHMYAFLQKLVQIVLPRSKDFQGVSPKSFDQQGNYTLGLQEQIVFPEVNYDKIGQVQGLEITLTTSTSDPKAARLLLESLGMPFAKPNEQNN